MSDTYILDGKTPVPADLMEWARWFETANLSVGDTQINAVRVSTVFLGLDHRFGMDGDPILFETMIFGGAHDGYQERYCTWDEAEAGHAKAVALVLESAEAVAAVDPHLPSEGTPSTREGESSSSSSDRAQTPEPRR